MDPDARLAAARDAELERLRAWRNRRRDLGAGAIFAALGEGLRRRARSAGSAGELWEAHCPPDLVGRTRLEGVRAGVMTVLVDDAPTRYALERALRSGLEETLIRSSRSALRRVRLRLAP